MYFLFQDSGVSEELLERSDEGLGFQSFFDLILQSGTIGIAIVGILFILFAFGLYIFFERYFTISRAGRIDQHFMNNIRTSVQAGSVDSARNLCRSTDSPMARMVGKGLQRIGKPLSDIEAAIENVGNLEVFRLEKNLSKLASIAGAAPMIGFFGTVTGMIIAFYKMATEENVTPDLLAGGIYQALITTAVGLFIGILAFIGYNFLVSSVEKVIFKMEGTAVEFMDLLQEPSHVY